MGQKSIPGVGTSCLAVATGNAVTFTCPQGHRFVIRFKNLDAAGVAAALAGRRDGAGRVQQPCYRCTPPRGWR